MTLAAEVNYLGEMEDHPVAFSYNREAGNLVFDRQRVALHDIRAEAPSDGLGKRGIMLADIPFGWPAGESAQEHLATLRAGVLEFLTGLTGAAKIMLLGPFVRHGDPALAEPGKTPAHYIHADYTAKSFARAARDMLAGDPEADRWLSGRRAIYQTWTAISPAPQDSLLTLLDRSTLRATDIVEGTVVVGTPETPRPHPALLFRHNPEHKWYFASDMQASDTLIFLGLDGGDDALPGCPHTAFENPAPGAVPRVSAEMRAFVFWG